MRMAKASKEEWEACMRFANELEQEIKCPEKTDQELAAWVRQAPCLFRVVFGYQILVDNCADPALDHLDFNPKIKAALAFAPDAFVRHWDAMATEVHQTAKEKGWWDNERNDGELLALIHSEISEALEGLRHGNQPDDKVPEFSSAEAELADAVIRIMDMAKARGWQVGRAIVAKSEMNKSREVKHGGKKF